MREILEDAEHHKQDGYGRAQAHARQSLAKRFYKQAGVAPVDNGFSVTLDGRPTRTPGRKPVIVPAAAIATAMADEWSAQKDSIEPLTMPVVRIVNSAIEAGEASIGELRREILSYAGSDLMLYRAEGPESLVAAQDQLWDAALVSIARHFGVSFRPTIGIMHQEQPESTKAKLAGVLEGEGHFVLTALTSITTLTGSGLLAIALWHRLLSPDEVWTAAHVDEDFQMRQWGEVEEAVERRARRRAEFAAAVLVMDALRA